MTKKEKILTSLLLAAVGVILAIFIIQKLNKDREIKSRNTSLSMDAAQKSLESGDYPKSAALLEGYENYEETSVLCEFYATKIVGLLNPDKQLIESGQLLKRFSLEGYYPASDNNYILVYGVVTPSGIEGLFGCLVDNDLKNIEKAHFFSIPK